MMTSAQFTESHYGLENIDGRISADGGITFLKKWRDMTAGEFDELAFETEIWLDRTMSDLEVESLKIILT